MGSRIVSGRIISATKKYPMDRAARELATFELNERFLNENQSDNTFGIFTLFCSLRLFMWKN